VSIGQGQAFRSASVIPQMSIFARRHARDGDGAVQLRRDATPRIGGEGAFAIFLELWSEVLNPCAARGR
jgi:hypothetical protein